MPLWVAAGFGVFLVVSSVIGVRLLMLWRRTRQSPELLIGMGVLGIGPVGFALSVFGTVAVGHHPALGRALLGAALLGIGVGSSATFVFNWRVFRPDRPWAKTLVGTAVALFAAAFVIEARVTGFASLEERGPGYLIAAALCAGCLIWGSVESLRYYAMMRRRARLGLADPLVTNRFLLWGLGIGAAAQGATLSVVTEQPPTEIPWLTMSSSLHGLVAASAMALAFLPPAAYRRAIERRAAAA